MRRTPDGDNFCRARRPVIMDVVDAAWPLGPGTNNGGEGAGKVCTARKRRLLSTPPTAAATGYRPVSAGVAAHCELNWPALAPPAAAAPPVRRQAQDQCSTGNAGCTQYQHVHATPGEWEGANRSLVACDSCFTQALFSRSRDATGPVLHCPAARLFVELPCQGHTCGLAPYGGPQCKNSQVAE